MVGLSTEGTAMPDPISPTAPPYRCPDTAPFIYFDLIGAFGTMAGAVQVELAGRVLTPVPDGGVAIAFMTTARLRCSPAAAQNLREALDKALQMLEQPDQNAGTGILQ